MKKLLNLLKKSPVLWIFIILTIFFIPTALALSSESSRNSIVTSIGIDKAEDEFEVSILVFIPTANQSFVETYKVISTKGSSVAEALEKAGLQLGRRVYLFHTETAVLGSSVLDENVASVLDYLVRMSSLPQSCALLTTNGSAKELLQTVEKVDQGAGVKIEEVVRYNADNVYCSDMSVEAFFCGYFGPTQSSLISYLKSQEKVEGAGVASPSGESDQGGGGEGSTGSSQGTGEQKEIKNEGDAALFKDGKFLGVVSQQILQGINWINPDSEKGLITIANFSDENFDNAKLIFNLQDKYVAKSVRFENGCPIFSSSINIVAQLVEVQGDKKDSMTNTQVENMSEKLQDEIQNQVRAQFSEGLNYLRENKTDIMGVYNMFYRRERKNFKKFLDSLEDKDDFLNYVMFELVVRVISR